MNRTTAQVAVEAILNNPAAFDRDTIEQVKDAALSAGVALYWREQLDQVEGGDWWAK